MLLFGKIHIHFWLHFFIITKKNFFLNIFFSIKFIAFHITNKLKKEKEKTSIPHSFNNFRNWYLIQIFCMFKNLTKELYHSWVFITHNIFRISFVLQFFSGWPLLSHVFQKEHSNNKSCIFCLLQGHPACKCLYQMIWLDMIDILQIPLL